MQSRHYMPCLCAIFLLPLLSACPGKKQVENARHQAQSAATVTEGEANDGAASIDAGKTAAKGLSKDRKKIPASPNKKTKTGATLKPDTHKIDLEKPEGSPDQADVSVIVVEGTPEDAAAVLPTPAAPEAVPLNELGTVDLEPNTEYALVLVPEEGGATIETVTVVTLAEEPAIIAVVPVGQGDVMVTIDTKDNPPDTEYVVAALPGGNAEEAVYIDVQTGQVVPEGEAPEAHPLPVADGAVEVTPDVTITNLPGDPDDYTYVVQAENSEDETTDWSDPVAAPGGVDSDAEPSDDDSDLWGDTNLSPEDAADVDVISADVVQTNQLAGLREEIKKLRAKLKELSGAAKAARAELKSAQALSRKLLKEFKRLKRDGKTPKDRLQAVEAEYNKAVAAVAVADKALGAVKQDRRSLRELIKAKLKEFKELKQKIKAADKDAKNNKTDKPEKKAKQDK